MFHLIFMDLRIAAKIGEDQGVDPVRDVFSDGEWCVIGDGRKAQRFCFIGTRDHAQRETPNKYSQG